MFIVACHGFGSSDSFSRSRKVQITIVTYHWLYLVLPKLIDEIVIVVDSSLVDNVDIASGQYSGP
jgi:hypothetical protein